MDSVSVAVDLRDRDVDELERELAARLGQNPPSLLWTARRPRKNWFRDLTSYRPLVLASSARFEQILWLSPASPAETPEERRQECRRLLQGYRTLFENGDYAAYSALMTTHIATQEQEIFPKLLSFVPQAERSLQELSYEHQGLEAGLRRLPAILEDHRKGSLETGQRERIDLDFFHLLEHNLERKLEAVYPALAHFEMNLG